MKTEQRNESLTLDSSSELASLKDFQNTADMDQPSSQFARGREHGLQMPCFLTSANISLSSTPIVVDRQPSVKNAYNRYTM